MIPGSIDDAGETFPGGTISGNVCWRVASDDVGSLEDQQTIPVIAEQLELILDVQSEEWWVDVSYPMLEEVRKKLRGLVHLIERAKKQPLYSDFEDEIGSGTVVDVPGTGGPVGSPEFAQFRKKAQHYLKEHLAEPAVAKVRSGQPLGDRDIA